jgi:hypothetical protein
MWNRMVSAAGLVLPILGIALALANWSLRPEKALAWAIVTVFLGAMLLVRLVAGRIMGRSPGDPATMRSIGAVPRAVVVAAVMVVIPLGVSLAHTYGLVSDREGGFHATMIIIGLYLAAIGNSLPRSLPPTSSMPGKRRPGPGVPAIRRLDVGAGGSRVRRGVARPAEGLGRARLGRGGARRAGPDRSAAGAP